MKNRYDGQTDMMDPLQVLLKFNKYYTLFHCSVIFSSFFFFCSFTTLLVSRSSQDNNDIISSTKRFNIVFLLYIHGEYGGQFEQSRNPKDFEEALVDKY